MGSSLPVAIEVEVRLQSTGEREGGEEIEAVSPDPSLEKFNWAGSERRWWQEEGKSDREGRLQKLCYFY